MLKPYDVEQAEVTAESLPSDAMSKKSRSPRKAKVSKLFVLDMLEFLRKTDPHLDRFRARRGGIHQDDHLSVDFAAVRQLVSREFPELAARLAGGESNRVIKRRPGTVDLAPLASRTKKR